MRRKDKIKLKILPDGRIVAETGKISMASHIEAANALRELTELMGGEEIIESLKKAKTEDHHHHTETHHSH